MKGSFLLRNSWSDENVSTIRNDNDVECETTHLTSFAVLVDVQGTTTTSKSVSSSKFLACALYYLATFQALSFVSYIGCGISIISLLLTMLAIFYWRYVHVQLLD